MAHNALALFVSAAMFRGNAGIGRNEHGTEEFKVDRIRAGRGLRRPSPVEPDMVEDDYYRFLRAPRD
jgi:hypothetical protein